MAIQLRRGAYADFDPTKMVPAEVGIVTSGDPNTDDGKAAYVAFSAGNAKRLATVEDIATDLQKATDDAVGQATARAEAAAASVESSAAQITTNKNDIADLKADLNNINGSWVKTNEIDYSVLTVSENKKITGYDTSTYLPILAEETGSVVADFSKADIAQYDYIKFPRCTKSTQWVILYGASTANNYTKSNTNAGTIIDCSNEEYGVINCVRLNDSVNFTRVAIAFDSRVDITSDSQFDTFFTLMDTVKENQYAAQDVRDITYSSVIDINTARKNVNVEFQMYENEQLKFTNNTAGNVALYAINADGTLTTISTGVSVGNSVVFNVDKDYKQLRYWSQQTGTVSVERINSVIYETTEESEKTSIASVNMFASIGAIGDSYTAGSTRNSAGTWKDYRSLSWIATMGKRSGTEWKNYGHGGATTKSYLETTEFASALSDTACDIYFFALGQNDGNQSLTIGTVADINDSDYTQNPETFYGCYGKIIQQIKNHAPNAKLVMITNWVQGSTWTDYDVAIRAIASHYSIPVIEPFDDYFFNSALYQNYKEYGHPTALGYSSMGIAMERLFSKCVSDNPNYFKFATIG